MMRFLPGLIFFATLALTAWYIEPFILLAGSLLSLMVHELRLCKSETGGYRSFCFGAAFVIGWLAWLAIIVLMVVRSEGLP